MLLIIRGSGDPGNDSKDGTKPVVNAVNSVRYPAAAAPVPAFPLQDCVENIFRIGRARHHIQSAGMLLFLERAGSQKFLHVLFVSQSALTLGAKFPLVLFFRGFHPSNGDIGAERLVESSFETSP